MKEIPSQRKGFKLLEKEMRKTFDNKKREMKTRGT